MNGAIGEREVEMNELFQQYLHEVAYQHTSTIQQEQLLHSHLLLGRRCQFQRDRHIVFVYSESPVDSTELFVILQQLPLADISPPPMDFFGDEHDEINMTDDESMPELESVISDSELHADVFSFENSQ
jgi:hypothetical protein